MKILIVKSASRVFNPTLTSLKAEFPDAEITVLAPPSGIENLEKDPLVDEAVATEQDGRMTVSTIGKQTLRELKSRQFDLAVSLYNIDHGQGYSNIDRIALAVRSRKIRGYNSTGKFSVLTPADIYKKCVLEKTAVFWIVVNHAATVFLFTLIALGICLEWAFRKCFKPAVRRENPAPAKILSSPQQ